MSSEGKLDIYLDGSCAFCQWSRARIEPWDRDGRLRFLNYNDPLIAAAVPYSMEELGREMHPGSPDGTWLTGFDAWVKILRALPGAGVAGPAGERAAAALAGARHIRLDRAAPYADSRRARALQLGEL